MKELIQFHTCSTGHYRSDRDEFGPCTWPYFNLFYVKEGSVRITLANAREIILNEGDVILFYPRTTYSGQALTETASAIVNRFTLASGFGVWGEFFGKEGCALLNRKVSDFTNQAIERLVAYADREDQSDFAREALLEFIVADLSSATLVEVIEPQASKYRELFLEMEKWLREQLHEDIDLDAMALRAGLSTSYFRSIFVKESGYPPKKFLARMRMIEAANLVRGTDLPIEEIAHRVGYSDETAFYRAFKRYSGCSPRQHRLGKAVK